FAGVLGRATAQAVPPPALAHALKAGSAVPPTVLTLAEGVLFGMFTQKLTITALTLAALAVLASGAGLFARRPAALQAQAGTAPPAAADRPPKKTAQPVSAKSGGLLTGAELRQALAVTIEFKGEDDPKTTLADLL